MSSLPSFIAGARIEPEASSPRIRSLIGPEELPLAETSQVQLRRALRAADTYQRQLDRTPVEARVEAARLVVNAYAEQVEDACFALGHFRGIVARDTRWMCDVNVAWGEQFEELFEVALGGLCRHVTTPRGPQGVLSWRTKGKACLFASATMDGPAAVVALCQAMLSGTHLILRPSFRDGATHLAFETLHAHGLHEYAQLVRWRSDAPEASLLNRQLLGNVAQGLIFSSNETFRELMDSVAPPASPEWDELHEQTVRYGTGLPLALVTANADLDEAARDLVEGARLGGGRFCLSAGPVLVERGVQRELLERVVAHASKLRRGSPLEDSTDLSSHDPESAESMRAVVRGFGGATMYGTIRPNDMDVVVLMDVPPTSQALYRELPGPVLALIPVEGLDEMARVATAALRRNRRRAWTALLTFGAPREFELLQASIQAFRYLHGGVVSRVKLMLPHQGSYFAADFMRRVSVE